MKNRIIFTSFFFFFLDEHPFINLLILTGKEKNTSSVQPATLPPNTSSPSPFFSPLSSTRIHIKLSAKSKSKAKASSKTTREVVVVNTSVREKIEMEEKKSRRVIIQIPLPLTQKEYVDSFVYSGFRFVYVLKLTMHPYVSLMYVCNVMCVCMDVPFLLGDQGSPGKADRTKIRSRANSFLRFVFFPMKKDSIDFKTWHVCCVCVWIYLCNSFGCLYMLLIRLYI